MRNIEIPSIERTVFEDGKNIVKQLVLPSFTLPVNIIESGRSYVAIEHDDKKIYFTKKVENIREEWQYVLLTNYRPTQELLESGGIIIKKWVKYPELNVSIDEIRNSWRDNFSFKEEDAVNDVDGLRNPQIGALYSLLGHLKLSVETGIVVLPTGTGKTETMLSTLIAQRCQKLLVTVPSDSLREQISNKFISLGLLKKFGIVSEQAFYPRVGVIKTKFNSINELSDFFNQCNVVVTTMALLTGWDSTEQETVASLCSHVFIDEAHHVKAATWNAFKNKFPKEKVVQFTATPFRNDGKRLDGKIIFSFPLRKAQEQGYFTNIEFIPIRHYDLEEGDKMIAERAVNKLRENINEGFNHILMARCATKERAKIIFELYKGNSDLNPVIVYSGSPNFKESYQKIISKVAKIIVCVDMLGEGFDLPELKIAAFHDIRKSLPITLQLAGRFTRTRYDEELGQAYFIANIADLDVRNELAELYSLDADWNQILSDATHERIEDEEGYKNFMEGFTNLKDSNIAFQNIKTKLSTVVYKNKTNDWFPTNFSKGIPSYDDLEFKFSDINRAEKILVIIKASKEDVEWVNNKEIYQIKWDIIVVYWETKNNLLFINSSDNSSLYTELAQAIIGENAELVKGVPVFKAFYDIKRVKLQNVGLRQFLGKNIRFRMMVGSDVAEALSLAEKQRGEKAFVMGVGYENGNPVNIGTSYKGRIWTKMAGDLKLFKEWCLNLGEKLSNPDIDPNQILKETLIPEQIVEVPNVYPVWIDWDEVIYMSVETKFQFYIDGKPYDLSNINLEIVNPSLGGNSLLFSIVAEDRNATFKLELFNRNIQDPETSYPDFKIVQVGTTKVEVSFGSKKISGEDFFHSYIPTIWFADGSALTGNELVKLKHTSILYPKDQIIVWDWTGVDLSKESQGVEPKITDSIQYKVIEELKKEDCDIIYDDDYSGEIADVLTIKTYTEKVVVKLYHLKFSIDGSVGSQIKNLYEVCGQAQKSIHWKHKEGKEFFNHLLRREQKTRQGVSCSRLEKGTKRDLEKLLSIAKNKIPIEFEIFVVQPGLSREKVSDEILTLLSVTENYVKEFAGITFNVIANA